MPWVTSLVEDVLLVERLRSIAASDGGDRLSGHVLLCLAFLCEGQFRRETVDETYARLRGQIAGRRSSPESSP